MLKIRNEQLRAFQPVAEAAFNRAVSQFLQKAHGDEMVSLPNITSALSELPQDVVREMVNGGIAKAREFGLEKKSELIQFVTTQILSAPNFFEHPIAQKVLGEIAQKAAGGFQTLMDEMTDKAWAEVAENYNPDAWGLPGPAPRKASEAAKAIEEVKPAEALAAVENAAQFEDLKPAELIQPLEAPKAIAPPKAVPSAPKAASLPKQKAPSAPVKVVTKKPPKKKEIKEKVQNAGKTQHATKVAPKEDCPNKNWIDLNYKYVSNRPVKNALFEVYAAGTNQCIAKGSLNDKGEAHVEGLPDWVSDVYFKYTSDPKPYEIFPKFKPIKNPVKRELIEPIPVEEGFTDKVMRYAETGLAVGTALVVAYNGTSVEVGKWVWGAVQGNWNEDQTIGQILVDMVISLIPFVDQAADVRDIAADLKKLIWDEQYDDILTWFMLVVSIVGCFPEVGSVVKGAIKSVVKVGKDIGQRIVKSGIDFGQLIKFLNYFGEGNVVKWLRDQVDRWGEFVTFVKDKIRQIIFNLQLTLVELRRKVRKVSVDLLDRITKLIEDLVNRGNKVIAKVDGYVDEIMEAAKTEIQTLVKKAEDYMLPGKTQQVNGAKQVADKPPTLDRPDGSPTKPKKKKPTTPEEIAKAAGMELEELQGLMKHCQENGRRVIVRFTNDQALRWHKFEGFKPKPVEVKLKTDKNPQFGGLVVKPKGPRDKWEQWERDNVDYLLDHKFTFDENNILRGPNGEKYYGDYDLQAVHLEVYDEATGQKVFMSELSNPEDTDLVKQINRDMGRPNRPVGQNSPVQHGAEHDFYVQKGPDGKPLIDNENYGKMTPASEADVKSGNRVLGRQHGADEQYLVVNPDGKAEVMMSPGELHDQVYKKHGMPWDYDGEPPTELGEQALKEKRAAEKAAKEAEEAKKAAEFEARRQASDPFDWVIDNVFKKTDEEEAAKKAAQQTEAAKKAAKEAEEDAQKQFQKEAEKWVAPEDWEVGNVYKPRNYVMR